MIKIISAMAAFLFITSDGFAALRTINPESKVMISANGNLGGNYAGKADIGWSYGGGLTAGYGILGGSILYTSFEFQYRDFLRYEKVAGQTSRLITYSQKYLDIVLAHRYLFKIFYFDAGAYYGKRIGEMTYEYREHIKGGSVPDKYTHDDYGFIFAFGVLLPFGDRYATDLNVKTKFGKVNIYTKEENVRNRTIDLSAGLTAFF